MISFDEFKTLKISLDDKILTVIFNRPEKLNAANDEMKREQIKLLDILISEQDKNEIGAIIFTGAGKSFTTGADIGDWKDFIDGVKPRFASWPSDFAFRMSKIYLPVICAVNGPAIGFGFNLLLWCDYVLTAPDVKFIWPPFVKRAISTELGSSFLISRIVGFRKAKQLYIFGDPLTAQEAYKIGLVDKIVPREKLLDEARKIAKKIIEENAPLAVRMNKKLITEALSGDLEKAIALERYIADFTYGSEDFKEAVRAFFDSKRKPIFKGK